MHVDIIENRVHLRGEKISGRQMNTENTSRVLRGQRGYNGHAIAAERRECFQIGLDAGAAGGSGARDRKKVGAFTSPSLNVSGRCYVQETSLALGSGPILY